MKKSKRLRPSFTRPISFIVIIILVVAITFLLNHRYHRPISVVETAANMQTTQTGTDLATFSNHWYSLKYPGTWGKLVAICGGSADVDFALSESELKPCGNRIANQITFGFIQSDKCKPGTFDHYDPKPSVSVTDVSISGISGTRTEWRYAQPSPDIGAITGVQYLLCRGKDQYYATYIQRVSESDLMSDFDNVVKSLVIN